jgi:hypothetical protein
VRVLVCVRAGAKSNHHSCHQPTLNSVTTLKGATQQVLVKMIQAKRGACNLTLDHPNAASLAVATSAPKAPEAAEANQLRTVPVVDRI